jgi:hypothetical protein
MKRTNDTMYYGEVCDLCAGPTLLLPSGSIWCAAEDPHPGGHFVKRVAFERTPARQAEIDAATNDWRTAKPRRTPRTAIEPRRSSHPTTKPEKVADPYAVGIDSFVDSDR